MKSLKLFLPAAMALFITLGGCSNKLDIRQNYGYSIATLPLPKSLKQGEIVPLEFSVVREGFYTGTSYQFRYFQPDGAGILVYNGVIIPVNRFQPVVSDTFTVYYQCLDATQQQQLDFHFEDNFGQSVEYSVQFSADNTAATDSSSNTD